MYSTYILHNLEKDKFYIGQTGNLEKRIVEHNSSTNNTFTSKYRPWNLYWSIELAKRASAIRLEKYLKGKNKEFYRRLPSDEELNIYLVNRFRVTPYGSMVRVPWYHGINQGSPVVLRGWSP